MAIAVRMAGRYRLRQMLQGRSRPISPEQRWTRQPGVIGDGDGRLSDP
jgi:hypothetical protein